MVQVAVILLFFGVSTGEVNAFKYEDIDECIADGKRFSEWQQEENFPVIGDEYFLWVCVPLYDVIS